MYVNAKYIIRIAIRNLFLNCPRYIHQYGKIEQSEYIPGKDCEAPLPESKKLNAVQDVLSKTSWHCTQPECV